jgi:surfactin synthase thioesterase subunit
MKGWTASMLRPRRLNAVLDPRLRLVCFPYAGGGVSIFREWPRALPPEVEVCSIELPGRDTLFGQPPVSRLPELVELVRASFNSLSDLPVVLFGHSLGALLAFELARALRREGSSLPTALCVSGHRAPHLPDPRRPLHPLPDAEFAAELHRLQGTTPEVLANQQLMDLFLPLLRADFALAETYRYDPEPPLPIPFLAWGGLDDAEVSPAEIAAWEQHTSRRFRIRLLPGSHFFLHSAAGPLLEALGEELRLVWEEAEGGG